ncbi:hypothetical protein CYLTODRAFT_445976 [Cylindrobasidium torrendii FP15055 ss-10]|uniref:Uncharacterized protein n=1 Tax=Cylindrobasidium torrendii FP15055 ss-10 TaxID=1314674 RepID=A0A0D7B1F9_9AGAR|nr:hypothetical protein CYLTODRAFT_445976 [Cylindrobasidium torrendii FP15055 ss-10]
MTNELTATYELHGDLTPGVHLELDNQHHTLGQSHNEAQGHSPASCRRHGHQDAHNITARYPAEDRLTRPLPARRPRPPTTDASTSQRSRATPSHNPAQNVTFPNTGVSWGMSENPDTMRARASRKRKVKRKATTTDTHARASTPEKKTKLNPSPRIRRVRVEDLTPGIPARPQSQEVMSNTSLSSPKFFFRLSAAQRAEFEAVNGRWGALVERVNFKKPVFISKLLFFPESRLLANLFTAFPGFERAWFFCLSESPSTFACPFCPLDPAATLSAQDDVGIMEHGTKAHNVEGKPGYSVWGIRFPACHALLLSLVLGKDDEAR